MGACKKNFEGKAVGLLNVDNKTLICHTLLLAYLTQFLSGSTSIWEFAKQFVAKQILLKHPSLPDTRTIYTKIQHGWFGYLNLLAIPFSRLLKCQEECSYVHADGPLPVFESFQSLED